VLGLGILELIGHPYRLLVVLVVVQVSKADSMLRRRVHLVPVYALVILPLSLLVVLSVSLALPLEH
jgi:hypothetical protein